MNGQGEPRTHRRRAGRIAVLAALLGLAAPPGAVAADRATPSGFPVPRYVTLKFPEVNARAGPGDDHRLLWVYRTRGLPVQVIAENAEWRRICDPEGGMAWVHKRTTDGRRTLIRMQAGAAPLLSRPRPGAAVAAYLAPRSLAAYEKCDKAGWCKVSVDGISGWAAPGTLWGADERPQCG